MGSVPSVEQPLGTDSSARSPRMPLPIVIGSISLSPCASNGFVMVRIALRHLSRPTELASVSVPGP